MSIEEIANIILNSKNPEEVFKGNTINDVKATYRKLIKICHPDKVNKDEKQLAEKITIMLNSLYKQAEEKIKKGIYNVTDKKEIYKKTSPIFSFQYKGLTYNFYENIKEEDVSVIYEGLCEDKIIWLKIVEDINDNDLIEKEYKILKESNHLSLQKLIGKITINSKTALLFEKENTISIEELIKDYGYLNEEHLMWVLERLLSIVGYLHSKKIVHGNIKKENILIDVENHNVKLMDLTLSTINADDKKSKYNIINENYSPSYVSEKTKVYPNVDIYALGILAIELLGGDIERKAMRISINLELRNFIRKMLDYKENDAWKLWDELIDLRKKLYPNKTFKKLEKKLK